MPCNETLSTITGARILLTRPVKWYSVGVPGTHFQSILRYNFGHGTPKYSILVIDIFHYKSLMWYCICSELVLILGWQDCDYQTCCRANRHISDRIWSREHDLQ